MFKPCRRWQTFKNVALAFEITSKPSGRWQTCKTIDRTFPSTSKPSGRWQTQLIQTML